MYDFLYIVFSYRQIIKMLRVVFIDFYLSDDQCYFEASSIMGLLF